MQADLYNFIDYIWHYHHIHDISCQINPLKTMKNMMGSLTNSKDPDEMSQNVLFAKTQSIFREINTMPFENHNM